MTGTLVVRPSSQPSHPFGRPEALRAAAALAFAVGVAALTLPPVKMGIRSTPSASPLVETWMQVAIIAAALLTGSVVWQRARWYARRAADLPPGRSRIFYALMTILAGLGVAGVVPLRQLASEGRITGDVSQAFAAMLLLLTAFGLIALAVSELWPRPRFRHTGLVPRADAPSRRSVAAWPDQVRNVADPSVRGERMTSPLELACQALPSTPHGGGFMWNTSTVRSPCAAAVIPAALGSASHRTVRTSVWFKAWRWFVLALVFLSILAALLEAWGSASLPARCCS